MQAAEEGGGLGVGEVSAGGGDAALEVRGVRPVPEHVGAVVGLHEHHVAAREVGVEARRGLAEVGDKTRGGAVVGEAQGDLRRVVGRLTLLA